MLKKKFLSDGGLGQRYRDEVAQQQGQQRDPSPPPPPSAEERLHDSAAALERLFERHDEAVTGVNTAVSTIQRREHELAEAKTERSERRDLLDKLNAEGRLVIEDIKVQLDEVSVSRFGAPPPE